MPDLCVERRDGGLVERQLTGSLFLGERPSFAPSRVDAPEQVVAMLHVITFEAGCEALSVRPWRLVRLVRVVEVHEREEGRARVPLPAIEPVEQVALQVRRGLPVEQFVVPQPASQAIVRCDGAA